MMRDYRKIMLDAARALAADGDVNMRLSRVACFLIQLDDDDVPPRALKTFEAVRGPLIAKPLVVDGRLAPRDFDELQRARIAQAFNDLVLAELGGVQR
jgi:hypothetical protein